MSDELSDAAKAAIRRADRREGEIRRDVLRGAPVRGLRPMAPSERVASAQAARDRANKSVGLTPSPGLSAAEKRRFGLEYVPGT
ncbi:hypothetical protein GCM10023205_63890 [Yinghuangia aomiensis]|uniref:Uncharacterized protein n=1 Tax=Yinghuangia aomiensis TaxID=676205 RepID=A0ABP9I271_9ACTN